MQTKSAQEKKHMDLTQELALQTKSAPGEKCRWLFGVLAPHGLCTLAAWQAPECKRCLPARVIYLGKQEIRV